MKQYDAVIIGFGKGGKTLAAALGSAGQTVAVIERSADMYGGTCINVGCIPSKSLVHSAALSVAIGGPFAQRAARYTAAIEEKRRLTSLLRQKNYDKLQGQGNITVLTGSASFEDANHVAVDFPDGSRETVAGTRIFINTGARPFLPPIPGLEASRHVYVSETLLDLAELPRRLVIIGGGYIGMEFASIYMNFGSQVTVVQDGDVFLPREDPEIAQAVQAHLEAKGVRILFSAQVQSIQDNDNLAEITVETSQGRETLAAEAVLVATGRRPNTQGLHPEAAGVALTPRGAIQTDQTLRTTAPNIWAMGDVTGGQQFTYLSLDDFRIVRSQLLGDGARTTKNRGAIPYSVFLDPPFSRVGLTQREAEAQGYEIKVARLPAAAIPKAQVLQSTAGLLKAVIDAKTGRLLGVHLFCEESHEMINLAKQAMDAGLSYETLRDAIYTHPTMSEAFNDLFAAVQ